MAETIHVMAGTSLVRPVPGRWARRPTQIARFEPGPFTCLADPPSGPRDGDDWTATGRQSFLSTTRHGRFRESVSPLHLTHQWNRVDSIRATNGAIIRRWMACRHGGPSERHGHVHLVAAIVAGALLPAGSGRAREPTADQAWARGAASLVIGKTFESPLVEAQAAG